MITKPHSSPYQVTYDDLIKASEDRLKWMERSYPGMVAVNKMNSWTAKHNVEVEKKLLSLLKKYKKNPQTDLFKEYENIKA